MEFVAKIAEPSGQITERSFNADNEESLRLDLERRGLHVFKVKRKGGGLGLLVRGTRVNEQEFLTFNQELVALVHAGLPILQSLQLLAERRQEERFKEVLFDIHGKVKGGTSLSDAFSSHGELFPSVYAPTLMAGERSGNLEDVLRRYISYSQTLADVKSRVRGALVYPFVLVGLSVGLIAILMTYVIPRFASFYADFDATLPLITRILITSSEFARSNFWLLVALLTGAVVAFRYATLLPAMLQLRDRMILRLPLLGEVIRKYSISQFCRTLSTLLAGGLPLMPSLEISSGAVGNAFVSRHVGRVTEHVKEGGALTEGLERTGLMSDTAIQMLSVGESAGALTEMLVNVSDFYDGEVDRKIRTFVTLLEPALLVVMGVVIAAMLLAMYYPLFTLIQVVR